MTYETKSRIKDITAILVVGIVVLAFSVYCSILDGIKDNIAQNPTVNSPYVPTRATARELQRLDHNSIVYTVEEAVKVLHLAMYFEGYDIEIGEYITGETLTTYYDYVKKKEG